MKSNLQIFVSDESEKVEIRTKVSSIRDSSPNLRMSQEFKLKPLGAPGDELEKSGKPEWMLELRQRRKSMHSKNTEQQLAKTERPLWITELEARRKAKSVCGESPVISKKDTTTSLQSNTTPVDEIASGKRPISYSFKEVPKQNLDVNLLDDSATKESLHTVVKITNLRSRSNTPNINENASANKPLYNSFKEVPKLDMNGSLLDDSSTKETLHKEAKGTNLVSKSFNFHKSVSEHILESKTPV